MKKARNSAFGIIFPPIIGLMASVLIALTILFFDLSYLILFVAFLIPHYMLKHMEYIKRFHYYLGAAYSVLAFIVFAYARIFFVNFFIFLNDISTSLNISFGEIFRTLDIFEWLILIIMPIISYRYLKMKS